MTAPAKPKLRTHTSVDYGHGMVSAHCGICAHFKPPSACELVQPPVSRIGWCKLFKREEKR